MNIEKTIEWIKENVCYLKSWNSTHLEAKFTAVDIFDYKLQDKYYRGMYRENGISLYDLAVDVFTDAHIEETDYFKKGKFNKRRINKII